MSSACSQHPFACEEAVGNVQKKKHEAHLQTGFAFALHTTDSGQNSSCAVERSLLGRVQLTYCSKSAVTGVNEVQQTQGNICISICDIL